LARWGLAAATSSAVPPARLSLTMSARTLWWCPVWSAGAGEWGGMGREGARLAAGMTQSKDCVVRTVGVAAQVRRASWRTVLVRCLRGKQKCMMEA